MAALGDLLTADGLTAASSVPLVSPLAPRMPHFAPKAKHVIFMFMEGGPSQYELFDPKPTLEKYHGSALPPSLTKDLNLAFIKPTAAIMASKFKFQRYGQSGMELSELLPHLGSCADDLCLVRSVHCLSGEESLAARLWWRFASLKMLTTRGATTTPMPTVCGWQAAG